MAMRMFHVAMRMRMRICGRPCGLAHPRTCLPYPRHAHMYMPMHMRIHARACLIHAMRTRTPRTRIFTHEHTPHPRRLTRRDRDCSNGLPNMVQRPDGTGMAQVNHPMARLERERARNHRLGGAASRYARKLTLGRPETVCYSMRRHVHVHAAHTYPSPQGPPPEDIYAPPARTRCLPCSCTHASRDRVDRQRWGSSTF